MPSLKFARPAVQRNEAEQQADAAQDIHAPRRVRAVVHRPAQRETEQAKEIRIGEERRALTGRLAAEAGETSVEEQAELFTNVFEYFRQRSRDFAEAAASELIGVIRSRASELTFENIRKLRSPVVDIEQNVSELHQQVKLARAAQRDYLTCAKRANGYIPVSREEEASDRQQTVLARAKKSSDYFEVDTAQALDAVESELKGFIQLRAAATETLALAHRMGTVGGAPTALPNAYRISVESPSIGARVSYSPCYFVNYTVFASPTSPVYGYIAPGRYIFMVTTKAHVRHKDAGEFDIPHAGIFQPIDLSV